MTYKSLIAAAALLVLCATPVLAQTANSGAGATAIAGGSPINFGSSTYRNTPDALAPGLSAGANQCVQSTSIGVSAMSFGISGGSTYKDDECNNQKWFALMMQASKTNPAMEYQMQWWAIGMACADPRVAAAAPPGVCKPLPVAPVAAAPAQPAPQPYYGVQRGALPTQQAAVPVQAGPPAWCQTASPAERARYPQCRG